MSKPVSATAIGAFVMGALALLVVGVLLLTRGEFGKDRPRYVLYFDGSVAGLDIGAPVQFRGVSIGKVVTVQIDMHGNHRLDIPVVIEFQPEQVHLHGDASLGAGLLRQLIAEGLRAKLVTQSMITGKLAIELNLYPDASPVTPRADTPYPEIPTLPSDFAEVTATIRSLTRKLNALPLDAYAASISRILRRVEDLTNSSELDGIAKEIRRAVANLDRLLESAAKNIDPALRELRVASEKTSMVMQTIDSTVKHVDAQVEPLSGKAQQALASLDATLRSGRQAMRTLQATVSEDSPLSADLGYTLREIAEAAKSLRTLTDYLSEHPEAILSGRR